eukprot:s657_g10.t1
MPACAQKANDTLFVEEGGLLGVEREVEFEPPEDCPASRDTSEPALDLELDDVTAVALAPLGGDFLQGFPVTLGWRKRRVEELRWRKAGEAGGGSFCQQDAESSSLAAEKPPESGPDLSIASDGEDPPKDRSQLLPPMLEEAMDSFLRDLRRASRPQRGSHDSAIHSFEGLHRDPETQVLMRGWLIKRAKLRPFQDSWQERLWHAQQG